MCSSQPMHNGKNKRTEGHVLNFVKATVRGRRRSAPESWRDADASARGTGRTEGRDSNGCPHVCLRGAVTHRPRGR